jgi:hypothetical protein
MFLAVYCGPEVLAQKSCCLTRMAGHEVRHSLRSHRDDARSYHS